MKIFLLFRELTCSVDDIFDFGGPMGKGYYGGLYRNHLSFIEGERQADVVDNYVHLSGRKGRISIAVFWPVIICASSIPVAGPRVNP